MSLSPVKVLIMFVLVIPMSDTIVAQEWSNLDRRFDSIYYQTAVELSKDDIAKAWTVSDSLKRNTVNPKHQLRALMLYATISNQLNNIHQAIDAAHQAEAIALELKDFGWQAKICGFLSTQYRNLGLIDKGKHALQRGQIVIKRLSDPKAIHFYSALYSQEMAYYEMEQKQYTQAIKLLEKSNQFFSFLPQNNHTLFYLATNEELFGRCYLKLQKYHAAEIHFNWGLSNLDQSLHSDSVLRGFIFNGLGQVSMDKKEYTKALAYFEQAETIALSSGFVNLQIEVYKEFSNYYRLKSDLESYSKYHDKFLLAYENKYKGNAATINQLVGHPTSNKASSRVLYVGLVLCFLLFFCVAYIYYRKKKETRTLEGRSNFTVDLPSETPQDAPVKAKEKLMVSKSVQQKILENLRAFEIEEGYLRKDISVSALSVLVDSNSKYLSCVLKEHKGKDFNSYINGLRIAYIVRKIQSNTAYESYKISYLADLCGFSSHSKFTAVFKQFQGVTPSVFLEEITRVKTEKQEIY